MILLLYKKVFFPLATFNEKRTPPKGVAVVIWTLMKILFKITIDLRIYEQGLLSLFFVWIIKDYWKLLFINNKCPAAEKWVKKCWHKNTTEYCVAPRKGKILQCTIMWMKLGGGIMLSKTSQRENKYWIIWHWIICGI